MIPSAIRLLLVLLLLSGVTALRHFRADLGTPVTLAAGALLLCALFAGRLAKGVRLPRLTGYLLVGVLVGPFALGFIPAEGVRGLDLVKGLAVSLIALDAGTELRWTLVHRLGRKVMAVGLRVCLSVFVVSWGALLAMRGLLPFLAAMPWGQAIAVAALISMVVVSFSPTVAIAVVQETAARGPFTEFLMGVVILGDLVVMIGFALSAAVTQAAFGGALELGSVLGGIGWELAGSLALGGAAGLAVALALRLLGRELPWVVSALCFALAEVGAQLHLSPLLMALAAGAVIANLDEHQAERLSRAVKRAGLPVFALFFAAAGAGLHLDTLRTVGPVALALVLLRAGVLFVSARRYAPVDVPHVRDGLWMGLLSQAGVTFGLAAMISREFPGFGGPVEVLIVAMVTLHELVGPVLMRRALVRSGEATA